MATHDGKAFRGESIAQFEARLERFHEAVTLEEDADENIFPITEDLYQRACSMLRRAVYQHILKFTPHNPEWPVDTPLPVIMPWLGPGGGVDVMIEIPYGGNFMSRADLLLFIPADPSESMDYYGDFTPVRCIQGYPRRDKIQETVHGERPQDADISDLIGWVMSCREEDPSGEGDPLGTEA